MAHYKRGKCRYQGKGHRTSTIHYRARHGLKPIIVPDCRNLKWGTEEYAEWRRWYNHMLEIWWPSQYSMMGGTWPRWHDILHHNRPRRVAEKATARKILKGTLDPEDTAWPLSKRPHVYYW